MLLDELMGYFHNWLATKNALTVHTHFSKPLTVVDCNHLVPILTEAPQITYSVDLCQLNQQVTLYNLTVFAGLFDVVPDDNYLNDFLNR